MKDSPYETANELIDQYLNGGGGRPPKIIA